MLELGALAVGVVVECGGAREGGGGEEGRGGQEGDGDVRCECGAEGLGERTGFNDVIVIIVVVV